MLTKIKEVSKSFLEKIKDKEIFVISHHDTDGITSAAIMTKTLQRLGKQFSVQIIKGLEEQFIYDLPKNKIILFLDLASGALEYISKSEIPNEDIFVIDHHEIHNGHSAIPKGLNIINPQLLNREQISSAGLVYLFSKEISEKNKDLAKLAVLGMIGDMMEKQIDKLNDSIIKDAEVTKKRGVLLYPSTRPLNRTLEFSSNPFIPGVSGNSEGALELLKEAGIPFENGKTKSLIELDEEEMSRLVTAILLRRVKKQHDEEIIGDIYLVKFFNKLEDARELSAIVNACSRLGESEISLMLCLENSRAKKIAETLYAKYKQFIISGLKFAQNLETGKGKIESNGYVIINAQNQIKDTMIGTIASILSNSSIYEAGTMITTMAYFEDPLENKIKISSRIVGRQGRNARETLNTIIEQIGGEVGGHEFAAGAIIPKNKEEEFINHLKKNLEIEVVKLSHKETQTNP